MLTSVARMDAAVSRLPSAAHTTSGLHRLTPVMEVDDSWLEAMDDEGLAIARAQLSVPPFTPSSGSVEEQALREEVEQLRAELAEARQELERLRQSLTDKNALLLATQATDMAPPPVSAAPCAPLPPTGAGGFPVLRQLSISSGPLDDELTAPETAATERRDNARHPYVQHVEFVAESHFFAGLTQDISSGGLFVATYEMVPVGTKLTIQLELPDGNELEVEGVVRWQRREPTQDSERPGIGIAFTNLSAENLTRIRAFCEARPPLYVEV